MERKCIAVCVVAGVLGLAAVVMGFVAESTSIKADEIGLINGTCYYPKSPSMALAIAASIILLIEQIVISGATGCFCCRGTPCPSSCIGITAIISFIFSWLICIGAIATLITGALVNNVHVLARGYSVDGDCPLGKSNLFIVGGALCIVSVTLGLFAYIALMFNDNKSIPNRGAAANEHGVATAEPQMPTRV